MHPSQRRPSLIDVEYVFQAINQELRLKMTRSEACGRAVSKEAIVILCFQRGGECAGLPHLMNTDESRPVMSFFLDHTCSTWEFLVFYVAS